MTPHEELINWYDSLPDELREKVAYVLGRNLPNLTWAEENGRVKFYPQATDISENVTKTGESWLKSGEIKPNLFASKILIARTLITFFVMHEKPPDYWESVDSWYQCFIERAQSIDHSDSLGVAKHLSEEIEKTPLRRINWEDVLTHWHQLCDKYISDEAIRVWLHDMYLRKAGIETDS